MKQFWSYTRTHLWFRIAVQETPTIPKAMLRPQRSISRSLIISAQNLSSNSDMQCECKVEESPSHHLTECITWSLSCAVRSAWGSVAKMYFGQGSADMTNRRITALQGGGWINIQLLGWPYTLRASHHSIIKIVFYSNVAVRWQDSHSMYRVAKNHRMPWLVGTSHTFN